MIGHKGAKAACAMPRRRLSYTRTLAGCPVRGRRQHSSCCCVCIRSCLFGSRPPAHDVSRHERQSKQDLEHVAILFPAESISDPAFFIHPAGNQPGCVLMKLQLFFCRGDLKGRSRAQTARQVRQVLAPHAPAVQFAQRVAQWLAAMSDGCQVVRLWKGSPARPEISYAASPERCWWSVYCRRRGGMLRLLFDCIAAASLHWADASVRLCRCA